MKPCETKETNISLSLCVYVGLDILAWRLVKPCETKETNISPPRCVSNIELAERLVKPCATQETNISLSPCVTYYVIGLDLLSDFIEFCYLFWATKETHFSIVWRFLLL